MPRTPEEVASGWVPEELAKALAEEIRAYASEVLQSAADFVDEQKYAVWVTQMSGEKACEFLSAEIRDRAIKESAVEGEG